MTEKRLGNPYKDFCEHLDETQMKIKQALRTKPMAEYDGIKSKWKYELEIDTTVLYSDGYRAEIYEEIDGTFSITIKKVKPNNNEEIYFREDVDCEYTAREMAELIIDNDVLKGRLAEALKKCDH